MIDIGIHHQFDFVEQQKEVTDQIVYELQSISMKLTANVTEAKLINIDTGIEQGLNITNHTHQINGEDVDSCQILGSIPNGRHYLKLVLTSGLFSSTLYSDGVIEKTTCTIEIQSKNSCSDQYYKWDGALLPSIIKIPNATSLEPVFEKEKNTIYTENGKDEQVKRLIQINRFEFVAPTSWIKALNGIVHNDTNSIKDYNNNTIPIRNISVDEPQKIGDGKYSTFTVSYEYKDHLEGNTCCEVINIDDILSPEYTGGGDCGAFAVTISESNGVLSPTPTDAPTGTVVYRWYKDGVYLANSTTVNVGDSGNYKVEAKVGSCVAYSTYFVPDECALFSLNTSVVNDVISAAVSNVPDGETASFEVKKDGATVSSSVPFTATATGTYFVHAIAGPCSNIKGVYVNITEVVETWTVGITQADGILTATTSAPTPTYRWELEVYNTETGFSSRTVIGTGTTVPLTVSGNYHLIVTQGGEEKTTYFYFQTSLNVTVTNLGDIANGSGSIQTIQNTTGNQFPIIWDNERYLIIRNKTAMRYRQGVAAGSLDVNEFDVVNGQLVISSTFPLTTDDIIQIKPV